MGSEVLLFFCPIFRSAFTHTRSHFPLFVAQSLVGNGNRTTKGSTLASPLFHRRLTSSHSRIPNPNRTDTRPILTRSCVFVRSFVHKDYRVGRLSFAYCQNLGFVGLVNKQYATYHTVMLDCGHNFCRACISLCWARAATPSCPQCRETFPGRGLWPNRPLGNIAERLKRLDQPGGDEEQIQLQLESLRREKGELEKQERKEQWICQDYLVGAWCYHEEGRLGRVKKVIAACPLPWSHPPLRGLFLLVKEKVKVERQKIVPEFKQLRQYLEEQECLLLARLGELEKQIKTRLKENAAKFSKKIIYLDGLIKEKECRLSGHDSLQDTGDVLSRCERAKLQQKEQMSHELKKGPISCSETAPTLEEMARKPQDALTTDTGEGMEESQGPYSKVNVTLDPDTAQSRLVLSEDQRSVMQGATQQSWLDNPQRFDPWPCVLGCEGFNSRRCWEVEVGCGSCWAVGVALESVKRKGPIDMSPVGGIWAVGQYKEKFQALTSPSPTPVLHSTVPRRVRVCLDHAGGRVMFVNVDSEAVIFTFSQAMFGGQRIHPWFWVGKGSQLKLS
ncbi:LOW QUALITY PROTEIN: E3 ubiquitin-protein ligase TRIM11-like [Spheniscus humboldti]